MPVPIVGGVIAIISGAVARILAIETLKFIATRALIIGAFTLILPVVLYNVFTTIMQETMNLVSTEIQTSGVTGAMVQLTGMAGWIGTQINLAGCFSIFLSAVALRFTLSFIRGG